jgi:hypothetical protein
MKIGDYIRYTRPYKKETYEKAVNFAYKVYPTNKDQYRERGQASMPTIVQQTAVGKIIESLIVRWATDAMNFSVLQSADYEIYSAPHKSFSSDIILGGKEAKKYFDIESEKINISSKGCYRKYGPGYTEYRNGQKIPALIPKQYSWVYQLSNNNGVGGQDKGEHDIYIVGVVDLKKTRAMLYAWLKREFVDKMFIKPFLPHLKQSKLTIMKETCGGLKKNTCGIDELLDKNYEPKKSI